MGLEPLSEEKLAERNSKNKSYESFLKHERKRDMIKKDFMFSLPPWKPVPAIKYRHF